MRQKQIDTLLIQFHALDMNNDGKVSKAEMLEATKEAMGEDYDGTAAAEVLEAFMEMDADGNQKIKLEGFLLANDVKKSDMGYALAAEKKLQQEYAATAQSVSAEAPAAAAPAVADAPAAAPVVAEA